MLYSQDPLASEGYETRLARATKEYEPVRSKRNTIRPASWIRPEDTDSRGAADDIESRIM